MDARVIALRALGDLVREGKLDFQEAAALRTFLQPRGLSDDAVGAAINLFLPRPQAQLTIRKMQQEFMQHYRAAKHAPIVAYA